MSDLPSSTLSTAVRPSTDADPAMEEIKLFCNKSYSLPAVLVCLFVCQLAVSCDQLAGPQAMPYVRPAGFQTCLRLPDLPPKLFAASGTFWMSGCNAKRPTFVPVLWSVEPPKGPTWP